MSNERRTTRQSPSPLSPFYDDSVLTEEQWNTLVSIVDTIISPQTQTAAAISADHEYQFAAAVDTIKRNTAVVDETLITEYLAESATSCPGFKDAIYRLLILQMNSDARKQLLTILNALT